MKGWLKLLMRRCVAIISTNLFIFNPRVQWSSFMRQMKERYLIFDPLRGNAVDSAALSLRPLTDDDSHSHFAEYWPNTGRTRRRTRGRRRKLGPLTWLLWCWLQVQHATWWWPLLPCAVQYIVVPGLTWYCRKPSYCLSSCVLIGRNCHLQVFPSNGVNRCNTGHVKTPPWGCYIFSLITC